MIRYRRITTLRHKRLRLNGEARSFAICAELGKGFSRTGKIINVLILFRGKGVPVETIRLAFPGFAVTPSYIDEALLNICHGEGGFIII